MSQTKIARRQHAVKSVSERRPDRTPPGDAMSELVVHVFRLNGLLTAVGDAMAQPAGQTSARWRVLAAIEETSLTVPQIARAWWLSRQSVQRVADALVEEGFAAYDDNPDHRRSKLVRITRRGGSALRRVRHAQRAWADELGADIGEADLRTANTILARIVRAMAMEQTPRDTPGDRGRTKPRQAAGHSAFSDLSTP
jgi:DNA-binding MarR family transcriptional regulator